MATRILARTSIRLVSGTRRTASLSSALLAIALAGCAAPQPYWAAKDAGRMPRVLRAHLDTTHLANVEEFTKHTKLEAAAFDDWMKGRLSLGIREATGADSIVWVRDLPLRTDTVSIAGKKSAIRRAAPGSDSGWILVVSGIKAWNGHSSQSMVTTTGVGLGASFGTTRVDEYSLSMVSSYHLSSLPDGKTIAYGTKDSRSIYRFYMDSTDWNKASKHLGTRIGEGIPGKLR